MNNKKFFLYSLVLSLITPFVEFFSFWESTDTYYSFSIFDGIASATIGSIFQDNYGFIMELLFYFVSSVLGITFLVILFLKISVFFIIIKKFYEKYRIKLMTNLKKSTLNKKRKKKIV